MQLRCMCRCHNPPDGLWYLTGVNTESVLEAAVACAACRNLHVAVFAKPPAQPKEIVDARAAWDAWRIAQLRQRLYDADEGPE
jgi:hypothetical protein